MPSPLPLLLLFLVCPPPVHSKNATKSFDTISSFVYLDRFVFTSFTGNDRTDQEQNEDDQADDETQTNKDSFGTFAFDIDFASGTDPYLLFYYAGFDAWNAIYNSRLSCGERMARAETVTRLSEVSQINKEVAVGSVKWDGQKTLTASGHLYFMSKNPHWFFVAVANCAPPLPSTTASLRCQSLGYCQGPVLAKVSYEMTNGHGPNKHFSYDLLGIREMYIAFFAAQTALLGVSRYVRKEMLHSNKLHLTFSLTLYSILLAWLSHLVNMIYYLAYAATGVVSVVFPSIASFVFNLSDLLLVYQLIYLAKGWTLVRYKISSQGRLKIAVLSTVTFIATVILDAWKSAGYDEATVVYFYATVPGLCVLYLRAFTWMWFVYCCYTTMKSFDSKKVFFKKFTVAFGAWMLVGVVMAIACEQLGEEERAKYMTAWDLSSLFVGQTLLILMYYPNVKFNKGFPFHSTSSVMLGLVQGQTASEFLAEQRQEVDEVEGGEGGAVVDRGGGTPPPLSLRHAKDVMKTAGLDLHRTLRSLRGASGDLMSRLEDLDDADEGDIDMGRAYPGEDLERLN